MKNSKILSKEEYEIKANKIKTESILYEIKKTNEYKALHQLNKKGIIDDSEFNEKTKLLLNKERYNKINKTSTNEYTESRPINDLPISLMDVIIPNKLKGDLRIDTDTLIYMLNNPNRYIEYFKNDEFPFFCALVLDSKET